MGKFLLIAAAAMLPGMAAAADMPLKAAPTVAQAKSCGWDGGYVGLEAAYGWNEVKATVLEESAKWDPKKFAIGGAAGYRFGCTLIFGLEISGKYASAKTSIEGVEGNLRYYGDVSAQLGLAINNGVLAYAIAGPSFANFQVGDEGLKVTANYTGFHFGGGIDIKAFTDNFVIGIQYKHHEWGDATLAGFVNTTARNDEVVMRALYRFAPGH